MKKVLVIGSNSFSGSDFIDRLLESSEYEVMGLSRSPEKSSVFLPYLKKKSSRFRFVQCDLNKDLDRVRPTLDAFQPQYVVNFAAQSEVGPSWKTPWDWFQTNTVALAHLIDYLKSAKYLRKYVHISSPEIYGTCEGVVTEEGPFNPSTPYAASKAAADFLLLTYFKNFNFPVTFIRSTNVYGAHQQLFKIIPRTVITIKSGKRLPLHGGGKAVKSYIHIRDISNGELAVMEQGRAGEVYHLSPDQGVAVRDVVEMICRKMNADFSRVVEEVEERLGQDKAYVIDSTKARREFGWKPVVTLDQGIDGVVRWVDEHWNAISAMPVDYVHKS